MDELSRVEQALGLTLPSDYRAFMLEFPRALFEMEFQIGSDVQTPAEWEFLGSAERLIECNRFVREEEIEWMADGGPWPEDKFVIGEDIGGDYFAVDLSGKAGVFRFCHEDGSLELHEPSLERFMKRVLREYSRST